jgi:hypothetical protein
LEPGYDGVIVKGPLPGAKRRFTDKVGSLSAEVSIVSQQERILRETFKSPGATDNFMAAIDPDNEKFYHSRHETTLDCD